MCDYLYFAGASDDHRRATSGNCGRAEMSKCECCGREYDADLCEYEPFGPNDVVRVCSETCCTVIQIDSAIEDQIDSRWEGAD